MRELSHFCDACFAGEMNADGTVACDRRGDLGHVPDERTHTTLGAISGRSKDVTRATKERTARAKKLLQNGRGAAAAAGDWVLVRIGDVFDERESEKGGHLAPVQLVAPGPVTGSGTAHKDNSKRLYLRTYERCVVEEKEKRYSLRSTVVCHGGSGCPGSQCPKRHEARVPLEIVISRPFKMPEVPVDTATQDVARGRVRRASTAQATAASHAGAAASSSASAPSPAAHFLLPPGIAQEARAVVAEDRHKYTADCFAS